MPVIDGRAFFYTSPVGLPKWAMGSGPKKKGKKMGNYNDGAELYTAFV